MLGDLGVGLVVGNPERALLVNEAFGSLIGYSVKEVLTVRPFADLVTPDSRDLIADRARRRLAGEEVPRHYECDLVHRDGHRVPVEVSAQLVAGEGPAEIVATFRDLIELKRVKAELATRAHQQAVVAEVGRRALADPDLSSLMDAAVDAVARTLDVEYAEVLELLPEDDVLLLRAGVGWEEGLVGQATVAAGLGSQAGFTLACDAPVVVEDLARETRFGAPPLLVDHGVVAGMTVLIRSDDEPYGVLGADTTRHRSFGLDDIHFLRAVANVVADAVARGRVEAELATRAHQQAVVAELGRRALADPDLSSLMDAAVDAVARTLDVEYAEVLELLPEDDVLLLRAGVGWEEGLVGQATVAAGLGSQAGFTLACDAPVVVEDLARETRFGAPPLLVDHGVVAGMTVLIRSDDEPYGVLGADTTRHRSFGLDDIHFLRAVANVVADAVARGRVEAELATRAHQQAVVAELGRRALADPDLSSLMDAAVDAVARTLDVEYAEVLELLPEDDVLLLRAGVGWEEGLVGQATVAAGLGSQAGFTLACDAPVVVEDLARETRFGAPPLLVDHGVVSGMSVVIMGRAAPWGVLGAYASRRRRFNVDDAHFLHAAANTLAEVIGRAEVEKALRSAHDEERRLRQRLETHSRAAVDAQEGERRRIAHELHDEIGQTLTGLKLALENHVRLSPEAVADRLGLARALVGELLRRVQDLSLDLRPAMLDDLGLRPALLWLVERYTAQTGVEVAFKAPGLDRRLRPEVETAAFRIVQEGLTNVARHAGVSLATVGCALSEDSLRIEVSDEGVGFEVDALRPGQSSGLVGMEERARATGGQFRLRSELGGGTWVIAQFPLSERPSVIP